MDDVLIHARWHHAIEAVLNGGVVEDTPIETHIRQALAAAWDAGAEWAGAIRMDGVVSHDNPYRGDPQGAESE